MTRIVINFTEPETKILDRLSNKTGLSYHDLVMRLARNYERNQ